MKLEELAIGKSAVILSVGGEGALRQHFLDMGLIQGTEVTMVKYAPMGRTSSRTCLLDCHPQSRPCHSGG